MSNENVHPLEKLLFDTVDQPKDEAIKELGARGIDTAGFLADIQNVVQGSYMSQLKRLAEMQQADSVKPAGFLSDLATLSKSAMLDLFSNFQSGSFGDQYKQAAVARCRNKNPSELSETELRSWLADIGETLGDPNKE